MEGVSAGTANNASFAPQTTDESTESSTMVVSAAGTYCTDDTSLCTETRKEMKTAIP